MENKYVEELRQEIKRLKLENKQLILLNQGLSTKLWKLNS